MKLLKLVICFSFIAGKSYSSVNDVMTELYIRSLLLHLNNVEQSIINEDEKKNFLNDTVYVMCDSIFELPTKIGNYKVKVIKEPNVSKEYPTIIVYRLFSAKIEKGDINIIVGDYSVNYDKEINFVFSGSQSFLYRYNKFKNKYIIIKTKLNSF